METLFNFILILIGWKIAEIIHFELIDFQPPKSRTWGRFLFNKPIFLAAILFALVAHTQWWWLIFPIVITCAIVQNGLFQLIGFKEPAYFSWQRLYDLPAVFFGIMFGLSLTQ